MRDEVDQKRNHTIYVTNEAIELADKMAHQWGISRNAVIEMAIRAMYGARSAITYEVARKQALDELRQEWENSD